MSWIVNEFLATDAITLGRLVRSVDHPEQDYFTPASAPPSVACVTYQNFSETLAKAEGTKLHSFLTKLFAVSRDASASSASEIRSAACATYQLKNSGDYFHGQVQADPKAKEWLQRAFALQKDVFLVTGVRTVTDAQVVLRSEVAREIAASAEVPLEEALLAAGVPLPPGIVGGAGAGVATSNSASASASFEVPGEKVYAAQFRKLKFKLFKAREVDNAFLEDGNRWKVYPSTRGPDGGYVDPEAEAKVVDVQLGEEKGAEEGQQELGLWRYDTENFEMGGEEFVYVLKEEEGNDFFKDDEDEDGGY